MNPRQNEIYKKLLAEVMGWNVKKKYDNKGLSPAVKMGKVTPIDDMFDTSIGDIPITMQEPTQVMKKENKNKDTLELW